MIIYLLLGNLINTIHLIGKGPAIIFAITLLLSGQSSTITGTLTGQFITEGFLGKSWIARPWIRRIITRCMSILVL